jgi:hypothetical protein
MAGDSTKLYASIPESSIVSSIISSITFIIL